MIEEYLVKIAKVLPRGGAKLLWLCSKVMPGLRCYPVKIPIAPNVIFDANFDGNVFFPLLKYGCYPHQIAEDLVAMAILRKDDVVIDVGANIGYSSLVYAVSIGSSGFVHSFEPSSVTFPYLAKMASQLTQIKPWNLAASNSEGDVKFINEAMSDRSHLANDQDGDGESVRCTSLDTWVKEHKIERVNFLKIDAEGHDINVVKGASHLIAQHKPIIEFEAFTDETVKTICTLLSNSGSDVHYNYFRCANGYPISLLSKTRLTNNWFAIPRASMSRVPDFLLQHEFLIASKEGSLF